MKNLYIVFALIKRNIIPMIILVFTMTVILFSMAGVFAEYRYLSEAFSLLENSSLENALLIVENYDNAFDFKEDGTIEENPFKLSDEIKKHKAFDYLIYIEEALDNDGAKYYYYNDAALSHFSLSVERGTWLKEESDEAQCVIAGDMGALKIGDTIETPRGGKAKLVGYLGKEEIFPVLRGTAASGVFSKNDMLYKPSPSNSRFVFLNTAAI